MRKIFVLDTSVLIYDPNAFKTFQDSDILLPIAVIDELDKLKKLPNEAGKNARLAIRLLDDLSSWGDISVGILTVDNILVKIDTNNYPNSFGDALYGDTRILACAYGISQQCPDTEVTLVSRDFNLRIRFRAMGLSAESYDKDKTSGADLYGGIQNIQNEDALQDLLEHNYIDPKNYGFNLFPNECVTFVDDAGEELAYAKKSSPDKLRIVKSMYPWGLSPRNKEQIFAINLISDPNIPLVTMSGIAGTGKSLIALGTALELILEKRKYEKLVIYRPITPVDSGIGYLPGSLEEKLAPWMQPIMDNFEVLLSSTYKDKWKVNLEMFQKKGRIEMNALSYIRGRSIPNAVILIDESQGVSPQQMKTILTRAGENTKIILTGDIHQIDDNKLDVINNGLTYAIERFKDSDLAGHITFTKGERSKLATKAAEIM